MANIVCYHLSLGNHQVLFASFFLLDSGKVPLLVPSRFPTFRFFGPESALLSVSGLLFFEVGLDICEQSQVHSMNKRSF